MMKEQEPLISVILLGLTSLFFFFFVMGLIQHGTALLLYPWSTDYVEWPEIGRAWDLVRGRTIYTSWDQLPLHEANYTPLYTFLNAIGLFFFGPTPFFGRFLALGFLLGSGVIISLLVASKSRTAALLGGCFWLSSHMCWMWSGLVRVDNMAVFLNLLALLVFHRGWTENRARQAIWWSLLICVAAAYTRQTMVAAAVAILGTLLLEDWRLGLRGLLLYAGVGLGLFGLMLITTDGLVWNHLFLANMNEYEWSSLSFFFGQLWSLYHWMFPLTLLGLYVVRKEPLFWLYALSSTLVSLTIGKIGSSLNYLLELWASISLLSAIGMGSFWRVWSHSIHRYLVAGALGLISLIGWQQIFHLPWERQPKVGGGYTAAPLGWEASVSLFRVLPFWQLDPFGVAPSEILSRSTRVYVSNPAKWEVERLELVESFLSQIEGPIFSEDMNFTLSLGKEIMVQSFEFNQLVRQGVWDSQPWKDAVSEQRFSALVLMFSLDDSIDGKASSQRFSQEIIQLMRERYRLIQNVGAYWIYLPRNEHEF
jgi:hypothetical protein